MKLFTFLVLGSLIASTAFADDEVACDSTCSEGKKLVSFLDGETSHCTCVDEAEMDPTVENTDLEGDSEH